MSTQDTAPDEPVEPARVEPDAEPREGAEPSPGDNQDVPARKIYPTDPTGAEPGA